LAWWAIRGFRIATDFDAHGKERIDKGRSIDILPKTQRGVMTTLPTYEPRNRGGSENEPWHLRLYLVRWTAASVAALKIIKEMEAEYLPPGSTIEVIDLAEQPEVGVRDNVLAVPTVVRVKPGPVRRIVGSLDDMPKTLKILGFSRD
jgi:circadian clock protein KaiB